MSSAYGCSNGSNAVGLTSILDRGQFSSLIGCELRNMRWMMTTKLELVLQLQLASMWCIATEVAKLKLDWRTPDNINGITRTVRLSLEFRGPTAQTINEFVRMQKDINTVILTSAELRLVARVTSMFLICKTEPMARYHVYVTMCIKHIKICGPFRGGVCRLGSHVFFLFRQQHTFIRVPVYKPEYLACESLLFFFFFSPIVAWAIVTCCTIYCFSLAIVESSWVVFLLVRAGSIYD